MLSDIERKVLRIIANFTAGRSRTPALEELCVKTGRSPAGIRQVLDALAKAGYIQWGPSQPDHIVLLEAWPRRDE